MEAKFKVEDECLPPISQWDYAQNFREARTLIEGLRVKIKRMGLPVGETWTAKGQGAGFDITKGKEKVGLHFAHEPNEKETHYIGYIRIYPTTTIPRILLHIHHKKREGSLYRSALPVITQAIESLGCFSEITWEATESFDAHLTNMTS